MVPYLTVLPYFYIPKITPVCGLVNAKFIYHRNRITMSLSQCGCPITLGRYCFKCSFMIGSGKEDYEDRSVGEASKKKKWFNCS